jgi:hypothetical protein
MSDGTNTMTTITTPAAVGIPITSGSVQIQNTVTISTSGSSITLKSNGTPDHVSPYYGVGHPEGSTNGWFNGYPGTIGVQNYAMTIPATCRSSNQRSDNVRAGMALNGVPIYNDREGGNVPVDAGVLGSLIEQVLTLDLEILSLPL